MSPLLVCFFFFFNDTATTEIYTLSLHDALPISPKAIAEKFHADLVKAMQDAEVKRKFADLGVEAVYSTPEQFVELDRKSTRLNSSHQIISYPLFSLKKKTISHPHPTPPISISPL